MKKYRKPLVGIEIAPHGPYSIGMILDALQQEFLKPERAKGHVVYVTYHQLKKVINVMCKNTPGVSFRQLETEVVDKHGRMGIVKSNTVKNGKQAIKVLWDGPPIRRRKADGTVQAVRSDRIRTYSPWQTIELWRLGVNKENQYFIKNITSKKPPPPKEKAPMVEKPAPIVLDRWDLVI